MHLKPAGRPAVLSPKRLILIGLCLGAYLLLVVIPETRFTSMLLFLVTRNRWIATNLSWVYIIAPTILLVLLATWNPRPWLGSVITICLFVLLATLVIDTVISTTLMGGLSTGAAAAINGVVALTILAWLVLLTSFADEALGRRSTWRLQATRWVAGAYIAGVALCSAGSGVAAAAQASWLSAGQPYCISSDGARGYTQIDSIFDLRGTNLFTERTGYKDTSRWFFHGVLAVQVGDRSIYWNWSKKWTRFYPLDPAGFSGEVESACQPTPRFVTKLGAKLFSN